MLSEGYLSNVSHCVRLTRTMRPCNNHSLDLLLEPNFPSFNDGFKYSNDDEKGNSISSIGLASITSLDVLKIKAADVNHPH